MSSLYDHPMGVREYLLDGVIGDVMQSLEDYKDYPVITDVVVTSLTY